MHALRRYPPHRTGCAHDQFQSAIQGAAAVVERIDGGPGLKMQIAREIDPLQDVSQESCFVLDVELRIVFLSGDHQVFGERQLALSQNCIGIRQQLLRHTISTVRHIAFAADGK